jgi:NitT/TauT family transport system ATP-binding protein
MAPRSFQMRRSADVAPPSANRASAESALRIEGLSKTYETRRGPVEAVRHATFEAFAGEFISLVGPSGCGKSTVLKIIAGLEPYQHGVVEVGGRPAQAGRHDVGIMLQSPVLFPWRTVLDNVLLPIEIFGSDKGAARRRASDLLDLIGLAGFHDKYPWECSGGMQQRVSLARLLVFDPDALLMDEPFGALDEFTRERMNFEVAGLHERLRKLVVFVTHNIHEAVLLSDKVVVMKPRPGEVVEVVPIDLPRPRSADTLRDPRMTELVNDIRELLVRHSQADLQQSPISAEGTSAP